MNQPQSYMDVHASHVSTSQPYGTLPASGGGNPNMGHYQQTMMQGQGSYPSTPASYPTYSYANGVMSPHSAPQHQTPTMPHGMTSSMLPQLPGKIASDEMLSRSPLTSVAMNAGGASHHAFGAPPYAAPQPPQPYDTSGQVAPPGMKPRVTATLWEDEGSLCFQVEAKGVCVARREGTCLPSSEGLETRELICMR